jgi:DNA-binding NarL/FixJ family response regulator
MATPEAIEAKTLRSDRQHTDNPTILDLITPEISEKNLEPAITHFYSFAVNALRQRESVFLVAGVAGELPPDERLVSILPAGKFSIEWRQDDRHTEGQACVVLPQDEKHKEKRFLLLSSAIHQLREKKLRIFLLTYPKEKPHQTIVLPKQPPPPEIPQPQEPIRLTLQRALNEAVSSLQADTPHKETLLEIFTGLHHALETDRRDSPIIIKMPNDTVREQVREIVVRASAGVLENQGHVLAVRNNDVPPALRVIATTWKGLSKTLDTSRAIDIIVIDGDEPLTKKQFNLISHYVPQKPVIILESDIDERDHSTQPDLFATSLTEAIDRKLLRPVLYRTLIPDLLGPNIQDWLDTHGSVTDTLIGKLASDATYNASLAHLIYDAIAITSGTTVAGIHKCFIQTLNADQAGILEEELRELLPPGLLDRVVTIKDPGNMNGTQQYGFRQWQKNHAEILIAPTLPPHKRVPEGVSMVFLHPERHNQEMMHILVRSLQPAIGNYDPVTIFEMGPCPNLSSRGFRTLEEELQAPVSKQQKISPAINRTESRAHKPKHTGIVSLVSQSGIDLRTVPLEDKKRHMTALTKRQREVFSLALKDMPLSDIASQLKVTPQSVKCVIRYGLHSIDHPRIKKERPTGVPRYAPYLFNGESVLTKSEDERRIIYTRAHLTLLEIETMEAYIVELPRGAGVPNRVAEVMLATNKVTVNRFLAKIRRKLANPDVYAPKPPKELSLITPGGIDLRTLTPKERQIHWRALTSRQQEIIGYALGGMSVHKIATVTNTIDHNIRSVIKYGLKSIDNPRTQKEKLARKPHRAPYLFNGESILTKNESERHAIYAQAHLTPRQIETIEAYIATLPQGIGVRERVAQMIHTKSIAAVSTTLAQVRKKLANPEAFVPIPKELLLITPSGIDLRQLPAEMVEHHLQYLTPRQQEVLRCALRGMRPPDIARQSVVIALQRIDHPRIHKEKQPTTPREYKPYLWQGVSILSVSADERGDIYSKAHLNDLEIATMEAFIAALPLGKGVYKRVAQAVNAANIAAVNTILVRIRRKLEHPGVHVPKYPRTLTLITPNGIDLRQVTPNELQRHIQELTPRQQEVMELALKNIPNRQIAERLGINYQNVWTRIQAGLRRIDHPRVKKENTYAPRAWKQFLFKGQSISSMSEEQRKEVYSRTYLFPREILAIESYLYADQQNLKVYEHVAQILPLNIARVGWVMTNIRKKLADPEKYKPKTRLTPSLVTPEGIDLRKVQPDELQRHIQTLTPKQQEVMVLALKNVPICDMAIQLVKYPSNIRRILQTGLWRIDHPKVKKEKTHAPRKQVKFFFEEQSLFEIPEDQRKEIYARVHLTPKNILAIESYIFAKQNGLEVMKHVTQSLNAPSVDAVGVMLSNIRKKLADPEKYKPKTRGRKPGQHRETTPPRTTISAQTYLLSQITEGDKPTPKISKKTIHTWAAQQMLPKEIFRYDKPNLIRWNQYVTLMRTLIHLSKEHYPDLTTTITQPIRENDPIPSVATIVQRIEALLPELLLRAYINRFPEQPMTKQHMDDALEHQGLAEGNSTKPLLTILKVLDESVENAQLFGNHSPFSAYTLPYGGYCIHLKRISDAQFSAAAYMSYGKPCREAIRTRVRLSRATTPIANFLKPILLQDNQQNSLEQALKIKYDWATIYLDIAPLALGEPETKRQRELAELINTKILH